MDVIKGILKFIMDRIKSLDKKIFIIFGAFIGVLVVLFVIVPIFKAIIKPKPILTYEKTTSIANEFVIKYTIFNNGKIEITREQGDEVLTKEYKLSGALSKKVKQNIKKTTGSLLPRKTKENYAIVNIYNTSSKNWIEISGVLQNNNNENELAKSYYDVLSEITQKYTDKIEAYRLKLKK